MGVVKLKCAYLKLKFSAIGGFPNGGGFNNNNNNSYASDLSNFRKPSRLEALPVVQDRGGGGGGGRNLGGGGRKKGGGGGGLIGGPALNTMGTF